MSEEQDLKSFKIQLSSVDEKGESKLRDTTVTLKKVIIKEKAEYFNRYCPLYSMNMSITIPDHIHKKLCGAVVERKRGMNDKMDKRTYDTDFSKTITGESLSVITERYRDIIYDYQWLLMMERMNVTKVIFYSFDGAINLEKKASSDGKKIGKDIKVSYGFLVGFISEDKKVRFNIDKKIIADRDGEYNKLEYVEYTPERESFFENIFSSFESLIDKLNEFKIKLSPTFIDQMINDGIKLLN